MRYQDPDSSCKRKSVRFANENTFVVPGSLSFSISRGSSSSASSGGPLTPPDLGSGGLSLGSLLPGPTPFSYGSPLPGYSDYDYHQGYEYGYHGQPGSLPPKSRARSGSASGALQLHAQLEFSSSRGPAIRWDLVDIPSTLALSSSSSSSRRRSSSRGRDDSRRFLDEPATVPPTSIMTISCPHLPWIIRVYPASSSTGTGAVSPDSRNNYVSVRDVLTKIYTSLRHQIGQAEYEQLTDERDKERAGRAYKRRYRRILSGSEVSASGRHGGRAPRDPEREYEEEKAGGLRRVDFLMERTRFGGLSRGRNVGEWVLHVE